MKVVCINDSIKGIKIPGLTYGKIYDADREDRISYYIKDDISPLAEHLKRRFTSIQKWREQRINKILEQ